jgi:hypothetical protein
MEKFPMRVRRSVWFGEGLARPLGRARSERSGAQTKARHQWRGNVAKGLATRGAAFGTDKIGA